MPQEATLPKGARYDISLPKGARYDTAPPATKDESSYLGETVSGAGRGLKTSLIDAPIYMGKTALDAAKKYGMFAPTMAVTKMLNDLIEGLGQGAEARRTVKKQGEGLAGQTLATLENYPVIGPMVQHAEKGGTKMFSPESIGASTEALFTIKGPEIAQKGLKTAGTGVKIASQEIAGAGREPVFRARQAREAQVAERTAKYEQKVEEARKSHETAQAKKQAQYEARKEAARVKHEAEVQALKEKHAAAVEAAKEPARKAIHERGATQYGKSIAKAKSVYETTIRSLQELKDRYTKSLTENVTKAWQAEKTALDQRWGAWREKIKGQVGDGIGIRKAVDTAMKDDIKGSPESIKLFREITGKIKSPEDVVAGNLGYPNAEAAQTALGDTVWNQLRESASKDPTNQVGIPAQDLHGFYTELGEKMYSGREIPGDVYQAMKHVREAVGKELENVSNRAGVGKEYGALKSDWADYENTWRDPVSPLSKVVNLAKEPVTTKMGVSMWRETGNYLKGVKGQRAMELLGRKTKYGADPTILARVQAVDAKMSRLPKPTGKIPEVKLSLPAEPKYDPFSPPEPPKMDPFRMPRAPDIPPGIIPENIRKEIMLRYAGKPFSAWDFFFPPKLLEHLLAKSPAFREWVSKQPRNELTR